MTDNAARYLAFAFASAELLFEIDPEGCIVLAMGATNRLLGLGQDDIVGVHWSRLFTADGRAVVGALIEGLDSADRRGPVRAELKPLEGRNLKRYVSFSACRLPQVAPNISCAVSLSSSIGQGAEARGAHGLHTAADFIAASESLMRSPPGVDLDVAFIEFGGLTEAAKRVDAAQARDIVSRVAAAVRAESFAGQTASLVGGDRFAMIRCKAETPDQLLARLTRACARAGAPVEATGVCLPVSPSPTGQSMRALKFALTSFIQDGAVAAGAAFGSILAETNAKAAAFSRVVTEKAFRVVYQPIVDLKTGELRHFEALSRLEAGDNSPAAIIRMAEELELIHELDMAVADQMMRKLAAAGNSRLKLAVNLSARSLLKPGFVQALLDKTQAFNLGGRLMFEITESSVMDDLDTANAHIQALRSRGFPVCLDDFGAGATALSYLRALSVDTVKIDGQYVRDIDAAGRADAVVRHLAELCSELSVTTVAEMVESQGAADILRGIGVDYGQGYHFGRPTAEPIYERPAPVVARRVGARESWG